jgi:hypothetical protein
MTIFTFYKIHLKVPNEELKEFCYVGMTSSIIWRKYKHKSDCNNVNSKCYNIPVYKYIRENGGFNAWVIEMLEEVEYDSRTEAYKRERYWLELEGSKLNSVIPSRTQKEFYNDNREQILQHCKEYRDMNKERTAQYHKEYNAKNSEKVSQQHKERYAKNKEIILQKGRERYAKNREQVLQRIKEYRTQNKELISQQYKENYQRKKAAQN